MFVSENKAILTLKKLFLFILFLGKSLSVSTSVGEFLKKSVCDLSCRPVVVSASWLLVKNCRRRLVVSASCLSVSYHRFILQTQFCRFKGLFPLRLLPISSTPISSTPTLSTVFIFQKVNKNHFLTLFSMFHH